YGALPVAAQPEVPMVEEEVDPVLLGLDRVVHRAGAEDLQLLDPELEAAGGASVGAQLAGDLHGGLLGELGEAGPGCLVDLVLHDHALDHPGAVADDDEGDPALGAEMRHPTLDCDGAARVGGQLGDPDVRRCHWIIWGYGVGR